MKLESFVLVIGFVLVLAGTVWSDSGLMSVQVKVAQMRSTPSFLGSIVCPLAYGDRVRALGKQGDWVDVKSSNNRTGWIHQSALTEKLVVLNSGAGVSSSASNQEIALAGKGFNQDVERQYRASNARLDYARVDRMESLKISRDQMISFLDDGKVRASKGEKR
ncbi:MAG: SH3 domain-containing protein [Syntrophobacteraceae bacterium]|nr:SH3 domain-containing protein [Syntrophobacteraceae bacterium]